MPDYPFAKYNVPQQSYAYSAEEYNNFLQGLFPFAAPHFLTHVWTGTDDNWSKEETDYLFSLVQEYDQRFYVIFDRYEFAGGPARSIEVSRFPARRCIAS